MCALCWQDTPAYNHSLPQQLDRDLNKLRSLIPSVLLMDRQPAIESRAAPESDSSAAAAVVPAAFDEWSIKTFFRFTCQETESEYQNQRILSIRWPAGILLIPEVMRRVCGLCCVE